ncbi:MAG: hypothetical protein LLF96_08525 [Eubacteriales bacterium]|nr:hypothetical protein [Eubacteriales bacterium]
MSRLSFSHRAVAWLCVLLLLVSLAPMIALSFYNHAFYDDFGFSLLTRDAWTSTGSVAAVLQAAMQNTIGIRQTWEGTYTTSFLGALQPAVFGESLYWITTIVLLGGLLLALCYFLWQALHGVFGLNGAVVAVAVGALGFVMVQFTPNVAEGFYWFNGGVAYTLLWSLLLLTAGLWLHFLRVQGRQKRALFFALLAAMSALLGGAKYSTVLYASLLAAGFTAWAFLRKKPGKWGYLALTAMLLAGFAFSMAAPGNAVRAQTLTGGMSAPKAVLEAVYFGLALIGHSFSLPLLAAVALVTVLAIPALRQSELRFSHPIWATLFATALYCAQLAPTLYTGNYLGDGRVINTYFFTFVLTVALLTLYWAGYLLRRYADTQAPALPGSSSAPRKSRVKAATLLLLAGLMAVGCVAYHPDGAASYGPQNMAGGSALRSVLSREAATFDAAMDRQVALLSDPMLTDVTLTPVGDTPASFMGDALRADNVEYVLNLYAEYYHKASVALKEE